MSIYTRPNTRNDNPNLALVILLVVFVISTIGLGLWGYYGYEGQEELKTAAKKKSDEAANATNLKDFYTVVAMELRLVLGGELTPDEKLIWSESRKELFKDPAKEKGKFDGVNIKTRQEYVAFFVEAYHELEWDDENGKYRATWKEKFLAQKADIDKLKADLVGKDRETADQAKKEKTHLAQIEALERKIRKLREDGELAVNAAKNERRDYFDEQSKRNSELLTSLQLEKETNFEREKQWFKEKDELDTKMRNMEIRQAQGAPAGGVQPKNPPGGAIMGGGPSQPLALDISMGKPLWDTPVGKVLSVIGDKVLIQVDGDGLTERLKTKLTFNVFPAVVGKATGQLKGTLEVISLEGGRTAICRMTSKFNEKDNPMVEGDLIYNLVWGTHVAVIGQVNLFGKHRGESQLEQVGNLKHFLGRLEDQGVIVDAYIDLVDGTIKGKYGALNPRTRFLIRGDALDPRKELKAAEARAAPPDNDPAELKKMAEKRVESINENYKKLNDEAREMGLFIISPENFANIAGYRKLGGYDPEFDVPPFQPQCPPPT